MTELTFNYRYILATNPSASFKLIFMSQSSYWRSESQEGKGTDFIIFVISATTLIPIRKKRWTKKKKKTLLTNTAKSLLNQKKTAPEIFYGQNAWLQW